MYELGNLANSKMNKNNILVTRRTYVEKGTLFNVQLVKKGKGQVPIKASNERLSDIDKYGGYSDATGAYFMLVESKDKKGNKLRTLEYLPLHLTESITKNPKIILRMLEEERKLKNPQVIIPVIKKHTLFKINGFYLSITGRSDNRIIFQNEIQLLLDNDAQSILKKVLKFVERRKTNKELLIYPSDKLANTDLDYLYLQFLQKMNKTIYKEFFKGIADSLEKKKATFENLSLEEKCLLLAEILKVFQCNRVEGNLKIIGETGNAGKIRFSKNISNQTTITIINQSPTGIYEQEIDLKTV